MSSGAGPRRTIRVAVDVAGADLGPEPAIAGALAALADPTPRGLARTTEHAPAPRTPGPRGPREPGRRDPGQHDPGRRDPGPPDPGPRGPHDPGQHDPGRRDPGQHDPGPRESGRRDPGAGDPGWRDPGAGGDGTYPLAPGVLSPDGLALRDAAAPERGGYDLEIVLVGPERVVRAMLPARLRCAVRVVDAPEVVGMEQDPIAATWAKRRSSLLVAAGEVAAGRADAMVTPGNTGAAVLAAAARLRRVPGVSNPALATVMPVPGGSPTVLVDIGATASAVPEWLVEFAVLGAEYARRRLGIRRPRIGLLSNGHEAVKGGPVRRDAQLLLATMPGYAGQIEAYDILGDRVDVAVCDGFTGDVALKMYERTLDATVGLAIEAVRAFSPSTVLADERERLVTRAVRDGLAAEAGGALLGVRGVCVICHGAAKAGDIADGVRLAADCVRADLVRGVTEAFAASARPRRFSSRI